MLISLKSALVRRRTHHSRGASPKAAQPPEFNRWAYLDIPPRKIAKMRFLVLLLCVLLSVEIQANNESSLNGTWVADIEATERSILESAPRKDAIEIARSFIAIGGYLAISMLVIEDDFATFAVYGDTTNKGKQLKLISQNQAERKYIASDNDSSKGELTVTVLNNEYIRVSQRNDPLGLVVLWKRASPQPIRTSEALQAHLSVWQTSMEKIKNHLFAQDIQRTEPTPPKRWSEDVVLQDGRRIKVEREVSYTFNHSIGDAGSGFSVFKNKLSSHRLQFKNPDTGRIINWQGDPLFTPVLLDLIDGVPYLVLSARPTKETERIYGCTELPFIYLQYDIKSQTQWRPVPEDQAPRVLKSANLSLAEENKMKDHLSVEEVQETIAQKEKSSARFIQREIPRDYGEWRYQSKNSYRNERRRDDCRLPPQPPPDIPLPKPIDIELDVVGSRDYIFKYPEDFPIKYGSEVIGTITRKQCAPLFKVADPENIMLGELFVRDPTSVKKLPYTGPTPFPSGRMFEKRTERHCNSEFVWFIAEHEDHGKTVITKYTVSGDYVYSIRFQNPETAENKKHQPMVLDSLTVENGYFIFYWLTSLPTVKAPQAIYSNRLTKLRFREPDKPNQSINTDAAR
jgi:hypothetical protein